MKVYKFYNDAGHGWLAVKRQELIELGILNDISHYSYQRGASVYLEEDCDATRFINACVRKGWCATVKDFRYETKFSRNDHSPIRSYESFKA